MKPVALRVAADTVRTVGRGHPWVYQDGLASGQTRPPAGTPVRLFDGRDRPLAFGLADDGSIAVRVLSRHPVALPTLLDRVFRTAVQLRTRLIGPDTNAMRLINGAGDGLPGLVVDRYDRLAVVRAYGACWKPWLPQIAAALHHHAEVDTVVRRLGVRRVDAGQGLDLLLGPAPPEHLVVMESGLRFLVRPAQGQKTGLFLDQRDNRCTVRRLAVGRDMLDIFSCTGGFAVYAAAGNARRVTVVDSAPAAVDDARENLRLNGFSPDRHAFVVADAFTWSPDSPAGLVVCDPPNLSHGRDADQHARRQYRDLAQRFGHAVQPGGFLATASCTARLSWERWEQAVRDGLRRAGRWAWLHRAAEPPDHPVLTEHPEARYLKFAVIQRRPDPALPG